MVPPRLKPAKKKQDSMKLVDADDYLQLGDSHEEAMRKHRGGDPAKALRFADRALDVYAQGLAKFPRSFDMAYNKARLELEKATEPVYARILGVPAIVVLRQALTSHQYARDLEPMHADTLFNMAQVLTGMAEIMANDDEGNDEEALQNIEQALELQSRCFELQHAAFTTSRAELERAMRETAETPQTDSEGGQGEQAVTGRAAEAQDLNANREEQWVSIEEPVTATTLLDTIIAQIEALSALCSILSSSLAPSTPGKGHNSVAAVTTTAPRIDLYSTNLLTQVLPALMSENQDTLEPRLADVMLPRAIFMSNYLELSFRLATISVEKYEQELDAAFSQPGLDGTSKDVLLAGANALLSFNSALADAASSSSYGALRWKILVEAQSRFSSAAGMPDADAHAVAMMHASRGDISLRLQSLAYPPASHSPAWTTMPQLLRHAEVYYRNAGKLLGSLGRPVDYEEEKAVCELKGAVVSVLQQVAGSSNGSSSGHGSSGTATGEAASRDVVERALGPAVKSRGEEWVREQIEDMINEGMIIPEVFAAIIQR